MMRRAITALAAMLTGGVLALGWATPASAATTVCSNTTINGSYIAGDVTVPSGTVCFITNTYIAGTVTVAPGGFLDELNNSYVGGSVNGTQPADFDINNSSIQGGVSINGSSPGSPNIVICNNSISGNVLITGTNKEINFGDTDHVAVNAVAPCVNGGGNYVGGTLTVTNNTPGPVRVEGNSVSGTATISNNANVFVKNNYFGSTATCSGNAPETKSGNSAPPGSSCL